MTRRRVVQIRIEQLVDIHQRPEPAFFVDFRCRLCRKPGHALDTTTALDEFARHLTEVHRATGGYRRKK